LDGRNTGGGYTPLLNDYLTSVRGYPHSILNEGISGETTQQGLTRLPSLLAGRTDSSTFLILYGTNDLGIGSSLESGKGLNIGDFGYAGTYKDYLQQMIDLIKDGGHKIAIAKLPFALGESSTTGAYSDPVAEGFRNVKARDFNIVIDELIADPANNIIVSAPDFYTYFSDISIYGVEYFDNLHPNGLGYEAMAALWRDVLIP